MSVEVQKIAQGLRAKYPYQFDGPRFGAHLTTGWLPRFVQLYGKVDRALGEDKHGFHWDGCDEIFGMPDFRFDVHARKAIGIDACKPLGPIVQRAMTDLKDVCTVCGAPGSIDKTKHYLLILCLEHNIERPTFHVTADSGSIHAQAS